MVLSIHKRLSGSSLLLVLGLTLGGVAQVFAQGQGPASPPKEAAPSAAPKPGADSVRRAAAPGAPKKKAKPNAKANGQKSGSGNGQRVKATAALGAAGAVAVAAARPSMGQTYGLHQTPDPLDLKSSVALVLDRNTNEVLFSKNAQAVLPIASITKLMTSMVVFEHQQDLEEVLTVTQEDVDTGKHSGSRLAVGSRLARREMLHLALMSSENRAAHALGRHFPGGMSAFVDSMNQRARDLGMHDTRFVEPTGLSSKNQSSAHDLAILVRASHDHELLRQFSITPEAKMAVGRQQLQFRNTNGLVRGGTWDIALQKTGYISEAGRCVVMQATLAGRELILVLLDSAGRYSRIGDAERLRKWITDHATLGSPVPEKSPVRSTVSG